MHNGPAFRVQCIGVCVWCVCVCLCVRRDFSVLLYVCYSPCRAMPPNMPSSWGGGCEFVACSFGFTRVCQTAECTRARSHE